MVVGWALYYFMSSMSNPLPWASCPVVNRTRVFNIIVLREVLDSIKISGLVTKATLDVRG